jgi:hypothetical protein
MIFDSMVTCPRCSATRMETMPVDACRVFYDCAGCGATLRPKPGDCCVFCSYGSVPCPPMQGSVWVKRVTDPAARTDRQKNGWVGSGGSPNSVRPKCA